MEELCRVLPRKGCQRRQKKNARTHRVAPERIQADRRQEPTKRGCLWLHFLVFVVFLEENATRDSRESVLFLVLFFLNPAVALRRVKKEKNDKEKEPCALRPAH